METFIAAGGRYQPQLDIEKIVIEGGKATGIAFADGRTVRARQFVASTLNVHQTLKQLIGRRQLPAAVLQKLDKFQYTAWSLFGLHLAMHEPARLTAEAFDPNIHQTLKWSLGAETMDDLLAAPEARPLPRQRPPGNHMRPACGPDSQQSQMIKVRHARHEGDIGERRPGAEYPWAALRTLLPQRLEHPLVGRNGVQYVR
jgi:hypothetical protein